MVKENKVVLRSYPKAVFLYPLFFCTLFVLGIQWSNSLWAIWSNLFGWDQVFLRNILSLIWLIFLFISLFVISIEVKLSKLMAIGFLVIIVIIFVSSLGINIWLLNPGAQNLAVPELFYFTVLIILIIVLGGVLIGAHFDYAKIERNQITCTKGISGKSKETYPTRSVEINIQRPDFLEMLLGTGRISLKIPSLNKFIPLNTVFRAGRKHRRIQELLKGITPEKE